LNSELISLQQEVREELYRRGFSVVRFAALPLGEAGARFKNWLQEGHQGEMSYLSRRQEERADPSRLLPKCQSLILMAADYDSGLLNTRDPTQGHISRYTWGDDYHQVIKSRLQAFEIWLKEKVGSVECFHSVDASPVLEKAWAQKAGLGWLGKHTNIIHPEKGSYFFLSALLTTLPFIPDSPTEDRCGTCEQCIQICPTQAIVAPYVLDARLCISYLTIELKGPIPRHLRPLVGNHIFGCDDCQEVCPWNRFSQPTEEGRFYPRQGVRNRPLKEFLTLQEEDFSKLFAGSAVLRAKWKGFMRNVLVAVGNSREVSLAPSVREKLTAVEPLVRGHAVWAYHRLLGEESVPVLQQLKLYERDPFVLEEIEFTSTSQNGARP
jgi:epoxyqueuosine reductase